MNLLTILINDYEPAKINDTVQSIIKFADQIVILAHNDKIQILNNIEYTFIRIDRNVSKTNNLNNALKQCNSKWILYLNSGELLVDDDSYNIRDLIATTNPNCGAFLCRMENVHTLVDSGSSNGFYPRLFVHSPTINQFFTGFLFEQISFTIIQSGRSIYPSQIGIIQTENSQLLNHSDNIALLNQVDFNLQDEYYWYELGLNYILISDFTRAEDALIDVFEHTDYSFYIKELASLALSGICRRSKRFDEAILWAEIAYDLSKDKTYSLQALANAHLWKQNLENAKEYFQELDKVIHQDTYKYYYTSFPQIVIDAGLEEIAKNTNL